MAKRGRKWATKGRNKMNWPRIKSLKRLIKIATGPQGPQLSRVNARARDLTYIFFHSRALSCKYTGPCGPKGVKSLKALRKVRGHNANVAALCGPVAAPPKINRIFVDILLGIG